MSADASNIAASVARSLEVDRTTHPTQRSSEIAQDQLAGESVAALHKEAPNATNQITREKIRQERERRRRELEHRLSHPQTEDGSDDEGTTPSLDVIA